MTVTTRQMLTALRAQRKQVELELKALKAEQDGARTDLGRVDTELATAWEHLLAVLVPTMAPELLDRAARRIHLREIDSAQIHDRLTRERAEVQRHQASIHAQPLFQRRDAVRNEASIRLDELDGALAPLEHSVTELECEPFFAEIYRSGYGTEGYVQRFWQSSYYRHWKYADLIVERHAMRLGVQDFAGIRRKYAEERDALASLRTNRTEWRNRLRDLDQLEAKATRLAEELTTLERRTLVWVRGRVREHLDALPDLERSRMLGDDEELRVALARVSGVSAKHRYLAALLDHAIQPPIADLSAALDKANRDITKLIRPKNIGRHWQDADYQRRFGKDRTVSWSKRRSRIRDARTRVVEFHDYSRWDPMRDFLWWDVMTDGQLDGNFIDEVRARGPHTFDRDAAAIATAATRDDYVGDVS